MKQKIFCSAKQKGLNAIKSSVILDEGRCALIGGRYQWDDNDKRDAAVLSGLELDGSSAKYSIIW